MPENPNVLKDFDAFCRCGSWPTSEGTTLKNTVYSPRQNDVISTKIIFSELIRKNMSSQLQQINSLRILISTFLSQQFWAGFGSGGARWVSKKEPAKIPQTRCQQKKMPFRKFWIRNISTKKFWPNYFPKNVISNSTINFMGINIDLISTATVENTVCYSLVFGTLASLNRPQHDLSCFSEGAHARCT